MSEAPVYTGYLAELEGSRLVVATTTARFLPGTAAHCSECKAVSTGVHRTSLMRKSAPLGPYSRAMSGALRQS